MADDRINPSLLMRQDLSEIKSFTRKLKVTFSELFFSSEKHAGN